MSIAIAQLMGYLDIDDDKWNSKMRSAQTDVEKSGGWLSGLGGVAKGVGLGLLGVGGAAAFMGVKTAMAGEQSQIAFETLLGSATEAKDFLDGLAKFAAATPFEMPGLVSAARQLIGVGASAESVIPTLTAWGDTAGALGLNQEQFGRAMNAVTQAMGKGKLQAEEMAQITEAGIPIWPLLAKAMGKTIPELQEMSQKGELLAEDVFPLLEKQMGKDYGGAMEKQSQTLQGVWSTLMDTVSQGLAKVLTPLLPMMTKLIPQAAEVLGKVFEVLGAGIQAVMGWFKGAGDAGSGMSSVFGTVFGAIKGFIADNWATFEQWFSTVSDILTGVRDLALAIWARITEFWEDHGQRIMQFVQNMWEFIKTIIGAALEVIKGIINTAIAIVTGDWSGAWENIKKIVGAVWEGIKALIGAAWEIIKTVIGTALSVVWDIVRGKWDEIKAVIGDAIDAVKEKISTTLTMIKGAWTIGWNAVKSFVSDVWEGIKGIARGALDTLLGWIDWVFQRIQDLKDAILGARDWVVGGGPGWGGLDPGNFGGAQGRQAGVGEQSVGGNGVTVQIGNINYPQPAPWSQTVSAGSRAVSYARALRS